MFNDKYGLTQAVLDGRKTMTRRVYKLPAKLYGGLEIEDNKIITFDISGEEIATSPKYYICEVVAIAQPYRNIAHPDDGFLDERYDKIKRMTRRLFERTVFLYVTENM